MTRKPAASAAPGRTGLGQAETTGLASGVAARIRQRRQALRLTQDDLARRIGVSRSAVAQWETDRTGQVRANLTRVAAVLGVSVGYLLDGGHDAAFLTAEGSDERALLNLYRDLQEDGRAELLRIARAMAASLVIQHNGDNTEPLGT